MFVLIDTRGEAKVIELGTDDEAVATSRAFAMLTDDDREHCDDLGKYQETLGPISWYHVCEIQPGNWEQI